MSFLDKIFGKKSVLNFADYSHINTKITSEMFYSILRVLHDTLPCTKNFNRRKKTYR